eukprot:m.91220 g.91220  ORF g.91220 m.91220 type:complete len:314 (-) comp13726_c0_seq4:75-1016(-)
MDPPSRTLVPSLKVAVHQFESGKDSRRSDQAAALLLVQRALELNNVNAGLSPLSTLWQRLQTLAPADMRLSATRDSTPEPGQWIWICPSQAPPRIACEKEAAPLEPLCEWPARCWTRKSTQTQGSTYQYEINDGEDEGGSLVVEILPDFQPHLLPRKPLPLFRTSHTWCVSSRSEFPATEKDQNENSEKFFSPRCPFDIELHPNSRGRWVLVPQCFPSSELLSAWRTAQRNIDSLGSTCAIRLCMSPWQYRCTRGPPGTVSNCDGRACEEQQGIHVYCDASRAEEVLRVLTSLFSLTDPITFVVSGAGHVLWR